MYKLREEEGALFSQLEKKEALALIGPRRAGKTTIALRLLRDWKENGGQGGYIDLEALGAPSTALELVREIEKTPAGGLVVLDEVQAVDKWVKVVRGEIETGKRHLIITGSSAALLSAEIASSLAGRAVPEPVLPLSFRDAVNWGITSLDEYLHVGGYPECILRPLDAPKLHKLYFELAVLRDVAARKGIREVKPLSDLALILLSEPGKSISAKKTAEKLGISQPTFRSFVSGLNDAFLILSIAPFLRSPREKLVADNRHYAYDTGLQSTVSASLNEDSGRRFENVVAIELIRRGYAVSYLQENEGECDFIAQKPGSNSLAIQIWVGNGQVPQREWIGLELGMKRAKAQGLFLTKNIVEQKQQKGITIKTIQEWLREPKRVS